MKRHDQQARIDALEALLDGRTPPAADDEDRLVPEVVFIESWRPLTELAREAGADGRQAAHRVEQQVMARLRSEPRPQPARRFYSLAMLPLGWEWLKFQLRQRFELHPYGLGAVSLAAMSAVLLLAWPGLLGGPEPPAGFNIGHVSGAVVRVEPDRSSQQLRAGEPMSLPATLEADDSSAEASLSFGGKLLDLRGPVRIELREPGVVSQTLGRVKYNLSQTANRIVIEVPQGQVEGAASIFDVVAASTSSTLVRVQEGWVRLVPTAGPARRLDAGEEGLLENDP